MKKVIFLILTFIISLNIMIGQNKPEVVVPDFKDKYSDFVKKLESGHTDINYREFRESFIDSRQFVIASGKSTKLRDLKREMYSQMGERNYEEIIKITKAMLSIDYTSLIAHKILRQTYEIIGDVEGAKKYKAIQFGLLNSIVKNGDGKTPETAWPVIQIEEEYFILGILKAKVVKQSKINNHGIYDKIEVTINGEKRTFYFEISKIFEGYKKLGL